MPQVTYLADEFESNHVSRLGSDRVRREDELVVCADGDLHRSSQHSRAMGESGEENAGVHLDESIGGRRWDNSKKYICWSSTESI